MSGSGCCNMAEGQPVSHPVYWPSREMVIVILGMLVTVGTSPAIVRFAIE